MMKTTLFFAFALFGAAITSDSEPSDKEVIALMNKVEARVAGGDVKALDELTTLPPSLSTPAFLTIFKENYNVYGATASNRAIGARCADLATAGSGAEEYLSKLLKGKSANNYIYFQQDSAIKCLLVVHNHTSVRILAGCLDEVEPEEIGPKVTQALALLNLPGAPVSPKEKVKDSEALVRWKAWWKEHRDDYAAR